jgi:hypothetical protein
LRENVKCINEALKQHDLSAMHAARDTAGVRCRDQAACGAEVARNARCAAVDLPSMKTTTAL